MGGRTIAHVFATFGAGGPQVRAIQLMARLGAGHRHVVMAMDGRTDAAAQLAGDLDVTIVPPPPRAGFFRTVRSQTRWLEATAPDLVLTYNWGAIESVAAARAARLPLAHHEDGFGPEEVDRRLLRRNWTRRLVLRGGPVIVPSAVLRDIAAREWRIPEERLHLLPNGVDLDRFTPGPPPGAVGDGGEITVGTVGGLRGEKDHGNLLRAFAASARAARLRIVGGGPLEAELRGLAAELGVGSRVEFVGAVEDTAPEYRRLDVFVLSSRTEQMPIALLEAMASGRAVVATDVGDVREILPAEQHDLVVPRGDPTALARAMDAALGEAELLQRLGASNRARVAERYELRACLDRFVAVYDAATSRSRT